MKKKEVYEFPIIKVTNIQLEQVIATSSSVTPGPNPPTEDWEEGDNWEGDNDIEF